MRHHAGNVPTYIAIGLAALAAIMSDPRRHTDLDATLLWLLTVQGRALDMPQPDPQEATRFVSP